MLGMRIGASMLAGAIIARPLLSPWLVHSGIVADAEFGTLNAWLIWPALGLLVAGSFVPLLMEGGAIRRSLRDLAALARGAGKGAVDTSLSPRLWVPLVMLSLVTLFVIGGSYLGLPPGVTAIALLMSLFLANVSARATGETDFTPAGSVGTVALMALSSHGPIKAIIGGSVSLGMSSQVAPTLWAFRAGHHVGASPRAQVAALILGTLIGAVVVVPVYYLVSGSYGLATETIPAFAALSFKATAEAVHGGLSALPRYASAAVAGGMVVGTLLTIGARFKHGSWLPTPAAMGIAMVMPLSASLTIFIGATLVLAIRRVIPRYDEPNTIATAAGGIAGESVMGVIIAALLALGKL
jgi:uncharacterized oligopeptide transporter (OPT) family protein